MRELETHIDDRELDRHDPQPLYEQIKDILVDWVDRTPLRPNDQIPSERELCEQFGVNRLTVRKAINELVQEGVLFRQPGKGTFVSPPKITQPLLVLRSFTEAMLQEGRVPGTKVHRVEVQAGSVRVCQQLQIEVGAPVVKLVRIRFVDNLPLALITSYLPRDLTSNLELRDFDAISLYEVLREKGGIQLAKSQVTLEPTTADHREATLLNVQPGQPMMLLRGQVFTKSERVIEYCEALYRGDKVRFAAETGN